VSDLLRSRGGAGTLPCPRCRAAMDEVVSIAPVAGEPGLTAYDCPNCGYVTSVLEPPKTRISSSRVMHGMLGESPEQTSRRSTVPMSGRGRKLQA
jgi:hypothetical protein